MKARVGILFLIGLGTTWACDSRQVASIQFSDDVVQLDIQQQERKIQVIEKVPQNESICTLCEEYATEALYYLANNETQTEIIEELYMSCSRMPPLKQECITLVDYYVPLFFLEVSSIQPEELCRKIGLCKKMVQFATHFREDKCDMCHHAVSEVLIKLKDPDTQLEILEILLKGCNSMQNYMKKCKKMVFEYGPLILTNAEQFLETTDICTVLHACGSGAKQASLADS